jgi:hypothetical protein
MTYNLPVSNSLIPFEISPNTFTPLLPNAVPTPTALAPTAFILRNPAASLTPPTPIIWIAFNAASPSHILLKALTFPNANGCSGAPANPPTPEPSLEFNTGLKSGSDERSSEQPRVFVAVMKEMGMLGAKLRSADRIMLKLFGFV